MNMWKHFLLFTKSYFLQLKRMWISLPLLFIFPILIVGFIVFMIASFFNSDNNQMIPIGLVDLDQTKGTEMVTQFITESSELSEYLEVKMMTEQDAKASLSKNEISTYIVFPEHFISHLLQGNSETLPIIGNPEKVLESLFVKEIIDSVTRHIRASQANILTIHHYAKELGMSKVERDQLLLDQFEEYVFYTLGSNQIVRENKVDHSASSNPIHYFGTSLFFIITTIWLLVFYHFFYSGSHKQVEHRMLLYGVTEFQQILARIFVSLCIVLIFSSIITTMQIALVFDLNNKELMKLILLTFLYSGTFLFVLAILDILISNHSLRLITHCIVTFIGIIGSGAIVPTIYFPIWIQHTLPLFYGYEAFHWMIEVIVNNRVYTNFLPSLLMLMISCFVFITISTWKERLK